MATKALANVGPRPKLVCLIIFFFFCKMRIVIFGLANMVILHVAHHACNANGSTSALCKCFLPSQNSVWRRRKLFCPHSNLVPDIESKHALAHLW